MCVHCDEQTTVKWQYGCGGTEHIYVNLAGQMNIWEFNASFVKAKLWFSKNSSNFADISNSFRVAFRQHTDSKFNVRHFNAIVLEKFVEEAFYKFTEFNNLCEDFVFNPRSLKDLLSENIIKNSGHISLLS